MHTLTVSFAEEFAADPHRSKEPESKILSALLLKDPFPGKARSLVCSDLIYKKHQKKIYLMADIQEDEPMIHHNACDWKR